MQLPPKYAIVLFSDEKLLPAACCTVKSALAHAPEHTQVHLFCVDCPEGERQKALAWLSDGKAAVNLVHFNAAQVIGAGAHNNDRFGLATWGRLYLDRLLPADLHRVLYLDCDVFVHTDLAPLFSADMAGLAVAACDDQVPYLRGTTGEYRSRIELPPGGRYFNSGMLLLDWPRILAEQTLAHVRGFMPALRGAPDYRFHDQDVINIALDDRICPLDMRWNMQSVCFAGDGRLVPWIAHYCGPRKPWQGTHRCIPAHKAYSDLLAQSPWPQFGVRYTAAGALRQYLKARVDYLLDAANHALVKMLPRAFDAKKAARITSRWRRYARNTDARLASLRLSQGVDEGQHETQASQTTNTGVSD